MLFTVMIVLSLIVWQSCISQPVFAGYYFDFLDVLPLSDSTHHYLMAHYKLGHPLFYAILAAITCLCLKNRYLLSLPVHCRVGPDQLADIVE